MANREIDPTFGARVKEERDRRDWSMAFLAGQSGVTEKTIWRWETFATYPQLDDAASVAQALGVSLDYLAGVGEAVA